MNKLFSDLMGWVDARFPATETFEYHMSKYYAPKNFNFWYFFGVLSMVVLVNQLVTGIWLTMDYNPSGDGGATINDGKRFLYSVIVERGSSAPNLLGKFNDKTALNADHTGGVCDGNVYFAWTRFTGNGGVAIFLSRSTDPGASWSPRRTTTRSATEHAGTD